MSCEYRLISLGVFRAHLPTDVRRQRDLPVALEKTLGIGQASDLERELAGRRLGEHRELDRVDFQLGAWSQRPIRVSQGRPQLGASVTRTGTEHEQLDVAAAYLPHPQSRPP